MQIAICDDEQGVREALAKKIEKMYPQAGVALYETCEELLDSSIPPDILLLDIQMPGKDGMETARILRAQNRRMILIFITGMEEYVFQAFDVGAFHYLVKPFSDEKLMSVLQNAAMQYEEQSERAPSRPDSACRYVVVLSGGSHIRILLDDIIYAEVYNRKVVIHKKEEDIEYYGKLSDLEQQAGGDFFRTHRAYLVHFKYVVKYNASEVYMEKGSVLLAKRKYSAFVKQYMRYLLSEVGK